MKTGNFKLPAGTLALALVLTGCAGDTSRNRRDDTGRTADHTGAMSGTGGTQGSGQLGTGKTMTPGTDSGMTQDKDSDRQNRTGTDTGMSSKSGTTGGGTSLSGTERGNDPHRRDR